jgi:hypothetical protein
MRKVHFFGATFSIFTKVSMSNFVRIITLFTLFISVSFLSHAQVYKWKDAEGKWRYSDIKPMKVKDVTLLHAKKAKNPKVSDEQKADEVSAEKNKEVKAEGQPQQLVVEKENLAIKKQNCAGAKSNLTVYSNGGRIRRANAKGEMVFLSDANIAKMKAKAQQDVNEYCS